ncbi:MAG: hypothetical protein K0R15_2074 [Clostridiales bacterium]|jgi:hypothetical protein|nr:hypothetical protein [Clostridiales bacterium]
MINFEEEIKKFKPCLEIEQAEDAIYNSEFDDITDAFKEMIKEIKTIDKNS